MSLAVLHTETERESNQNSLWQLLDLLEELPVQLLGGCDTLCCRCAGEGSGTEEHHSADPLLAAAAAAAVGCCTRSRWLCCSWLRRPAAALVVSRTDGGATERWLIWEEQAAQLQLPDLN